MKSFNCMDSLEAYYNNDIQFLVLKKSRDFFSESHTFNAETNKEYSLKRQLKDGDVIRAWGVYKDDTTAKFR